MREAQQTAGRVKPKPLFVALFFIFAGSLSFGESEFSLRLLPGMIFPLETGRYVLGGGGFGSLDWAFAGGSKKLLPQMGLALGGGFTGMSVQDGSDMTLMEGMVSPFLNFRIADRFSLRAEASMGIYQFSWNEESSSHLRFGAQLQGGFHISPFLSLVAYGGFTHFMNDPKSLINAASAGLGISLNLSELFGAETRIKGEKTKQHAVFPVSYAWYENNPVAELVVTNNEINAITDVRVSLFLEQYMNEPTLGMIIPRLEPGESLEVPLKALFAENLLDLTENISANARFILNYRSLGVRKEADIPVEMPIYHRNAMSWDDDRRAASFVSFRDPAAALFARYISALVDTRIRKDMSRNIQYALGLFEALRIYGLNYIIDPASSYVQMSKDSLNPDTLNYPYQTLFFRGGDCDDISILFCSMLEVLHIDTAFITVPGHIYMAFDAGSVDGPITEGLIEYEGRYWMPLEITIPGEGFYRAWRVGAREWRSAGMEAKLYPMKESWKLYPSVSVPGIGDQNLDLPEKEAFARSFERGMASMERFLRGGT
jgi:hypothetical protein